MTAYEELLHQLPPNLRSLARAAMKEIRLAERREEKRRRQQRRTNRPAAEDRDLALAVVRQLRGLGDRGALAELYAIDRVLRAAKDAAITVLRSQGFSAREIGALIGVSPQAIQQRLDLQASLVDPLTGEDDLGS